MYLTAKKILSPRTTFYTLIASALCLSYAFGVRHSSSKSSSPYGPRIDSLVAAMTLEEKIGMLHGNGMFFSAGVPRLGIPELTYTDGPLGIREELERTSWSSRRLTTDSATFFPNGSALAATWNPELAYRYGSSLGSEARARNKDIVLAPAINITRTPLNGRTFEYLSEDPFLNARLAVQAVKGIQSRDVAACIKHFAVNNQETNRGKVSVAVSERALREIYFPAFKACVEEGKALSVMAAYNKLRGTYCSENDYLQNRVLRREWGFNGFIVSDWGGVHSTVNAAKNGLDVEMGSDGPFEKFYFAKPLLDSVRAGKVPVATIDEKVRRILWVLGQTSMKKTRKPGELNAPASKQAAYDIAAESIVLLKNQGSLLPLKPATARSIALIGDNANRRFAGGGFGAGVKAQQEKTILEGLKATYGTTAVTWSRGYAPVRQNRNSAPPPAPDPALLNDAVKAAREADVAILCIGGNREYETEGTDRKDLSLPYNQQALADAVIAANPRTIAVVIGGAPYDLRALQEKYPAILFAGYNGSEGARALADVLSGKENPSGKLPFTFPALLEQSPAHALNTFPGADEAEYKEDILVGYRWFDAKNTVPLYCFGYGLSYTTFSYGALTTNKRVYRASDNITATLKLSNTGPVAGREVVQFYVSDLNPKVTKAKRELKAFSKPALGPGAAKTVTVRIPVAGLGYYDEARKGWVISRGRYRLSAASSSRDLRQSAEFTVN